MLTKRQVTKIIGEYFQSFVELLNLTKYHITVHVLHTNSKFLKNRGAPSQGEYASCYPSGKSKSADIIFHYDKHPDKHEVISTLLHELLHIRLSELSSLVTLRENHAHKIEEKIVSDFEVILIDLLVKSDTFKTKLKRKIKCQMKTSKLKISLSPRA